MVERVESARSGVVRPSAWLRVANSTKTSHTWSVRIVCDELCRSDVSGRERRFTAMATKPLKPRRVKAKPKKGSLGSYTSAVALDATVPGKSIEPDPRVSTTCSYAGKWI